MNCAAGDATRRSRLILLEDPGSDPQFHCISTGLIRRAAIAPRLLWSTARPPANTSQGQRKLLEGPRRFGCLLPLGDRVPLLEPVDSCLDLILEPLRCVRTGEEPLVLLK